jgi:hypothetical protein
MASRAQSTLWEFDSPVGQLSCEPFSGRIDVAHPELGLQLLRWNKRSGSGNILAATWSQAGAALPENATMQVARNAIVRDAYVRGCDLVANYQPTPLWPFSSQFYWRADLLDSPIGSLASLLLMVSLQTDLLDTKPQIDVHSQLSADEVVFLPQGNPEAAITLGTDYRLAAGDEPADGRFGCLLFRLPGGKLTYAEMAHPSDFRQLDVTQKTGTSRSNWQLFAHFLEKGVIRRARILSVVLPRENDIAAAASCCERFAVSPLPLTA